MSSKEPEWLRLQKMIFSRFVHQQLKQGGIKREVKDVVTESQDGTLLRDLLSVMSGKKMGGKPLKQSTRRVQQIDNLNRILNFIKKDCGVDTRVSAENVADKDEKLLLGLIFKIIMKFLKIDDDEEGEAMDVREALLLWFQNKTEGYDGVEIKDFKKSFHSALPYLALIHKMRPKLLDYDSLDKGDNKANLQLALDLGEKYLNIEKYISPEDLPKLNEISMIIYLTDWYYGVNLLQKQDIAARRVGKLVQITKLHDELRAQYLENGKKLKEKVDKKIEELNKCEFDDTLAGVKKMLDEFYSYKENEKSDLVVEQLNLSALFNNLALRLHNHKRPPFKPGGGLDPASMDQKFEELEKAEIERSGKLQKELSRQLHLQKLAKRYKEDGDKLTDWIETQLKAVDVTPTINLTSEAEDALDDHKLFVVEFNSTKNSRLASLQKIANELISERYENMSEIEAVQDNLNTKFKEVEEKCDQKLSSLEEELAKQKNLDEEASKEYSEAVNAFTDLVKKKKKLLAGNEEMGLEEQLEALKESTSDKSEVDNKVKEVEEKDAKQKARGIQNNPYTNISAQDVKAQWKQFELLVQKKQVLLEEAIKESKRAGLSEEQVQEIKDNFSHFDKDKDGKLSKRELRMCLQSLGEESTPEIVKNVMEEFAADKSAITVDEFTQFMFKQLGDTDTKEEILKSFGYLAYDKDTVTKENLTSVINGTSFQDWHVDYLSTEMKEKGEGYDYPTWTEEAFAR